MEKYFFGADIYLPDFERVDGTKWAVVACDQFTSQPRYWQDAEELVGESASTLRLILPEVYLAQAGDRVSEINRKMKEYLRDVLVCHRDTMIYVERVQSDGRVRRGIVGAVDLEQYSYLANSQSLIRATEGTVLERIPPRVEIRRYADIELPHIMVLIDDEGRSVIEPIAQRADGYELAYDFDLMLGGGHLRGKFIPQPDIEKINDAVSGLACEQRMRDRYGSEKKPLLFAIGDGNHSLAAAKSRYEEIKAELGESAAREHPARYALCEMVNLHDEALEFEPIYRVMFGTEPEAVISEFREYARGLCGEAKPQRVALVRGDESLDVTVEHPECQLTVGTVQCFIDEYIRSHEGVTVDYVHGEDAVRELSAKDGVLAFTFDGMSKDELFRAVIYDGALPRKTFSMGHARDKRYYVESRRISISDGTHEPSGERVL